MDEVKHRRVVFKFGQPRTGWWRWCHSGSFSSLLEDCRKLIYEIPHVRIKHCYSEANGCVDFMARKGSVQDQSFLVFESSPEDMIGFVEADMSGASVSRRCPELSVGP